MSTPSLPKPGVPPASVQEQDDEFASLTEASADSVPGDSGAPASAPPRSNIHAINGHPTNGHPSQIEERSELIEIKSDLDAVWWTVPVVDLDISEISITIFLIKDWDCHPERPLKLHIRARGELYEVTWAGARFYSRKLGLRGLSFVRQEVFEQEGDDHD